MDSSDYISIIAIIVSLGTVIYQWVRDAQSNKVNMEADYFKTLYQDHLLHKIPEERTYLHFSKKGILEGSSHLIDELNEIRHDSLYYLYADKRFYSDLKEVLSELEDYLIVCNSQRIIGEDAQDEVWSEIQSKLEVIYSVLSNKYLGK